MSPTSLKPSRQEAADAYAAQTNPNRGVREGSNPNASLVEKSIKVNLQPLSIYATPEEKAQYEADLKANEAAMTLADAKNYVKAPAPAATPPPATKGGKLDEAAINHLMTKGGLSRAEAEAQVAGNRGNVATTASNTGLGGSFDAAGQFVQVPTSAQPGSAERIAANNLKTQVKELSRPLRTDEVGPQYDTKGNIIKSAQQVLQETNLLRAKRATELQAQLTEMQSRQMEKDAAATAAGATAGLPPGSAPSPTQADPNAPPTAGLPPSAPPTVPGATAPAVPGQPDTTGEDLAVADAKTQLDDRLKNIDAAMPGAIDVEDAKAKALKTYKDQLDDADAKEKLDKEKALEKERNDLAVLDRSHALQDIENTKAQLDQINVNTENEIKNRRKINKLSGGHDFSGLNWVQKQTQQGLDTLNYLRDKAANMDGVWADHTIAIINTYGLDLKQAEYDKKSTYAADYSTYTTRLDDIRKELKLDNVKKLEMRDKAHADYANVLTERDFQYGDHLNALRLKAIDQQTAIWKTMQQVTQNQMTNAIKMLALSTKKGISFTPAAMDSFEKMIAPNLPAGWFSKVVAGGAGAGGYTDQEAAKAITDWYLADPDNNDIKTLGKADVAMLVSMEKLQKAPSAYLTPTGAGPAPAPKPGVPVAFGKPHDASTSTASQKDLQYLKEHPEEIPAYAAMKFIPKAVLEDAISSIPSAQEADPADGIINSNNGFSL